MCAILGAIGNSSIEKALIILDKIKTRGNDAYGAFNIAIARGSETNIEESLIIEKKYEIFLKKTKKALQASKKEKIMPNISIMHALHSIVGYSPQPLVIEKDENIFIFTGNHEIYNWKELNKKYKTKGKNDAEVFFSVLSNRINEIPREKKKEKLLDEINKTLDELDGTYAFGLIIINKKTKDTDLIIGRDILGVKPLWYVEDKINNEVFFSSEKKGLYELYENIEQKEKQQRIFELHPRKLLNFSFKFDRKENNLKLSTTKEYDRDFFKTIPEIKSTKKKIIENLEPLLVDAIEKRIPEKKFGVLFSGGVDSSFIAYNLKKKGLDFVCYTTAFVHPDVKEADDLVNAKVFAKKMGLKLKVVEITQDDVEKFIPEVVELIEETNVVKVAVGLTMLAAIKKAREDGVKVIFSGLGSEEIFAGYKRHRDSIILNNVNEECLSGLRKIYERDSYRDDCLSMNNQVEIRFPFLDKKLVEYALKIPVKYKITDDDEKMILRDVAKKIGMDEEIFSRKKKAAQYGSNVNKAISKVAKKNGFNQMSDYIRSIYKKKNLRIGALFSGGKDSTYAVYIMDKQNYDVKCLVSLKSKNKSSYMFHTPNIDITEIQAKAIGIPLIVQETKGEKEKELDDLKKALKKAKEEYGVEGIVSGAVHSNYQRERVELVCEELGLKVFAPLWHKPQDELMKALINEGFIIVLSSIAADGLNRSWFGKIIDDKLIQELDRLNKKLGLNQAGEGGEYESLVLDCPLFKEKIEIIESKIIMEDENTGNFVINKARLVKK